MGAQALAQSGEAGRRVSRQGIRETVDESQKDALESISKALKHLYKDTSKGLWESDENGIGTLEERVRFLHGDTTSRKTISLNHVENINYTSALDDRVKISRQNAGLFLFLFLFSKL